MFIKLRENKAFTLVEIMIVVAIIGLLIAIALPNFVKARNTTRLNLCKNNLRLIGHALEQWRITENKGGAENPADIDTLGEYIKGDVIPNCPNTGTNIVYSLGAAGDTVVCSQHGTYTISTGGFAPLAG